MNTKKSMPALLGAAVVLGVALIGLELPAQESALARYLGYQKEAVAAERRGEYEPALKNYLKMLEMIPHKPEANYSAARVLASMGNSAEALKLLERALTLGIVLPGGLDRPFDSLKPTPGYQRIQAIIGESKKPVGPDRVAFTIPEKDLLPEAIAYDPEEDCFYVGSMWKSKVLKIERTGTVREFAREKQDGLRSIAGMKVDAGRRILWLVSFVSQPWGKVAPEEIGWSAIFKYDLKTGRLIKKYEVDDRGAGHLFNDLTVTRSGDVFITDSTRGEIWAILHEADDLEFFFRSDEFMYTNGITLGSDDQTLYVASPGNGVFRIDIPSKECRPVPHPPEMTLSAIDGLNYFENSLIAVQPRFDRVARYYLDEKGAAVGRLEILEAHNPRFDFPTTGCIAGGAFYYIANSQAYSVNRDGTLFPAEDLKDVVILRVDLKPGE